MAGRTPAASPPTYYNEKENSQMENKMQIFTNSEFGSIRTVEINGEPWLVGKDVAEVLGYSNPRDALLNHVDNEDKAAVAIHDGRQNRNMTIINESGLYALVLSSKLPGAKKFRRWVTSEVLPSIRKHGEYINGQETMSDEELLARALLMAHSKIEEKDRQLEALKAQAELDAPKVAFANAVNDSKTDITVEKFAKIIFEKSGLRIGRNKLFSLLRTMGYLRENNLPYQKYMESEYFTTCEVIRNGKPYIVTLITGKG